MSSSVLVEWQILRLCCALASRLYDPKFDASEFHTNICLDLPDSAISYWCLEQDSQRREWEAESFLTPHGHFGSNECTSEADTP